MKSTTWILITLAVAVTASMVVAKSIIFIPQKAEAKPVQEVKPVQPVQHVHPAKVAMEPVQVQRVARAVSQRAPRIAPTPGLFEQAPRVDTPDARPGKGNTWTVLVVNGNMEEHVTYVSPEVKSPTP